MALIDKLTNIANAIRTKTGGTSPLTLDEMANAVGNLSDTSNVTAAASNVLTGKKFVNASGKTVTGTMANNGAKTGTISTKTGSYTIPKGYHNGSGTVTLSSTAKTQLVAENIMAGKTIMGVTGTGVSEYTKFKSFTETRAYDSEEVRTITVSGLPFSSVAYVLFEGPNVSYTGYPYFLFFDFVDGSVSGYVKYSTSMQRVKTIPYEYSYSGGTLTITLTDSIIVYDYLIDENSSDWETMQSYVTSYGSGFLDEGKYGSVTVFGQ